MVTFVPPNSRQSGRPDSSLDAGLLSNLTVTSTASRDKSRESTKIDPLDPHEEERPPVAATIETIAYVAFGVIAVRFCLWNGTRLISLPRGA